MMQEKPLALSLLHSKLQTRVVSARKGARQYTDVFLAGLIMLPEKAAWNTGKHGLKSTTTATVTTK